MVINYGKGGATKREGGHMKFYPYGKGAGGGGEVLAMLKGVHNKCCGSFYGVVGSFSYIGWGGATQKVSTL